MAENHPTPPIPLVVPFHNHDDQADKVAGSPIYRENERVSQTAAIAFTRQCSASRVRIFER